jgi:hypothetical protein
MARLTFCRNCPRCGSRSCQRVAYSFRPGTFRLCLNCQQLYKPPISLLVGIVSLLFGAGLLTFAGALFLQTKQVDPVSEGFAAAGAPFLLFGIWVIVRNATAPTGPLPGFPVSRPSSLAGPDSPPRE